MIQTVLAIFAAVLILVGILGFVIPPSKALTSGAPPYNIFHLCFGFLGGGIALGGNDTAIRAFLIGFGAIDCGVSRHRKRMSRVIGNCAGDAGGCPKPV